MRARRLVPPATAGILAAAFAACNSAIVVDRFVHDAAPPDEDAGDDAGAEAAREASTDAASDSPEAAPVLPACPVCPPPTDPYWEGVFPEGGLSGSDTAVCGVVAVGRVDDNPPAFATRELFEALLARPHGEAFACPRTVCATWGGMSGPCQTYGREDAAAVDLPDGAVCVPDGGAFALGCGSAGRRMSEMTIAPARARTLGGAYLAEQAALEGASVVAFLELAERLARHGAPSDLVDDCRAAAREEERHAAVVGALAKRLGGETCDVRIGARRDDDIASLAIENAVEGVVRETFAAAVAVYHASMAATDGLRTELANIARDELSHAELSRRIHVWAMAQLSADERARTHEAMRGAIEELRDVETRCARVLGDDSLRVIGAPDANAMRVMHAELAAGVWKEDFGAAAVAPSICARS